MNRRNVARSITAALMLAASPAVADNPFRPFAGQPQVVDAGFVRTSIHEVHQISRLPGRADIQRAILAPLEPDRIRVTVSSKEGVIRIDKGEASMPIALEIRETQRPTLRNLETLWKVGQDTLPMQDGFWRLPDAIIADFEKNTFAYRLGDEVYPLEFERIQGTFDVVFPPSPITEQQPWPI